MKESSIIAVFLSLVDIIICFAANFPEYMMGSPATIKNVLVTVLYIALWVLAYYLAKEYSGKKTWKFFFTIWLLTCISAGMYLYVDLTDRIADWYMFPGIAFIGPFYGLGFFLGSFVAVYIAIIIISLIMAMAATTV